jgi:hypothetical protein
MKSSVLTAMLLTLLACSSFAQKDETLFGNKELKLTGAWGASSTSLNFFDDDFAIISGGYGGVEFGKKVFLGWGGFKTTNDFEIDRFDNDRFELNYNGFMIGYMPQAHKPLHPKFMLLTGGGRLKIPGEDSDQVFVLQPSAGLEINILRWFRLGLDGGYRFVTDTDLLEVKDTDVSAPFGEITFKFGLSWAR